jgi:hypothetical protein
MPHAISIVISGGVVAGVMGPEIAKSALHLIPDHTYVGIYLIIGGLWILLMIVQLLINYNPLNKPRNGFAVFF